MSLWLGIVGSSGAAGGVSATGGTITEDGGYRIHTFNDSGTFTVTNAPSGAEVEWRLTRRGTHPEAQTRWNGLAAQEALVSSNFPAFTYCSTMSFPDDGGSKWYLPAMDELELCFRNFKPYTNDNLSLVSNVSYVWPPFSEGLPTGQNPSSDPQGAAYTATVPAQTSVPNFQYPQFDEFEPANYWTSSWAEEKGIWIMNLGWGEIRDQSPGALNSVRPVRRVVLQDME